MLKKIKQLTFSLALLCKKTSIFVAEVFILYICPLNLAIHIFIL
jgi:hypothetical protein